MKNKTKVLVAMSGGVDSSVAAMLMKKQGYEVMGVFIKSWSDEKNSKECNWKEERKFAMKIAAKLEIPLITLDFEKQYRKDVVEKMFKDYKKGITPNPDIDCNQKVKFPLLIKAAKKFNVNYVVTGHYSRIKSRNKGGRLGSRGGSKKYELLRAKDESKDQSYFLYRLRQNELKHLIFPIGDYTKKQVREIAKKNKFPNFDKKSTVGICFIGKVNLKEFLQKKIKPKKGKIFDPQGNLIGKHDGIYYYTIGQRLGPRYGIEILKKGDDKKNLKRWYVARKNSKKNEIIAAPEGNKLLYRKEIIVKNPHWINDNAIRKLFSNKGNDNEKNKSKIKQSTARGREVGARGGGANLKEVKVHVRIRQVGELLPSKLSYDKKKKKQFKVILDKEITGVSEGQAIVLYQGKKVLGGGVIGFK